MRHPDLDEMVAVARRDRPTPGALAAVALSLRVPFVAAPLSALVVPGAALAGLGKTGLSRLGFFGWGAGSSVALSGVVLAVVLNQPEPPAEPAEAPRTTVVVPVHSVRPAVAADLPETEPVATPSATPSVASRGVKEAPTTWDEPQLIERARRALASEPRRALALAQEHQRRFPGGALSVERDVIVLEALARTGQTAEARRRALKFEATHPKSIHLPRVQALLARLGNQ